MSANGRTRKVLILLGVLAAAAAAGYGVTLAIFPAPILPKVIAVPALRGVRADTVMAHLAGLGLRARLVDTVTDPLTPAGTVAWQSPAPATNLPAGAVVKLGVSAGAQPVAMPDVTDLDVRLATQVIEAAGLRTGHVDTVQQAADLGVVVNTSPPPGATVRPGDTVRVSVSSGPASVAVPDLVGLTLTAAHERLAAAELRIGTIDQRFEGKAGTILAQRPVHGELVTKESGVNLTISGTMP